jgi:alanyl-tRNA synthetase
MSLTHQELRNRFRTFFTASGHNEISPISLVPQDDPTTLFTGSGMQQLVPYLLGKTHPLGTRLFNIQPCIRAQDIEEVGDNRHTTSFEMMGNWSLGDYFKREQLNQIYQFLIEEMGLPPEKLCATVFSGDPKNQLPADSESVAILTEIFQKYGIKAELGTRIFEYGPEKNWWSRAGTPDNMPSGEPGGPDSEIFYDFGAELHLHENSPFKDETCHVNCDCGRYLEIGNSVFMQYKKQSDGSFQELPKMNVDFGGGLERILTAANNDPDVFKTNVYTDIIEEIEKETGKKYDDPTNQYSMRIIADHIKGAVFLIVNGVTPSNKEQGYILRRLLRRAAVKMHALLGGHFGHFDSIIDHGVLLTFDGVQGIDRSAQREMVMKTVSDEMDRFSKSLDRGLKIIEKIQNVDGKVAFDLYQTYGFPLEITEELLRQKGLEINRDQFYSEFRKHKEASRASAQGKFKGGLADQSEQTVKFHTATHLLHQALHDILGDSVRQEGSNITAERLRFDFYATRGPSDDEVVKVESIINDHIKEKLPVFRLILPKNQAEQIGARSFFKEKYPDQVSVYCIGGDETHLDACYSKEFCGGPHVENTGDIGMIKIERFKKIGSNMFRIYAIHSV